VSAPLLGVCVSMHLSACLGVPARAGPTRGGVLVGSLGVAGAPLVRGVRGGVTVGFEVLACWLMQAAATVATTPWGTFPSIPRHDIAFCGVALALCKRQGVATLLGVACPQDASRFTGSSDLSSGAMSSIRGVTTSG